MDTQFEQTPPPPPITQEVTPTPPQQQNTNTKKTSRMKYWTIGCGSGCLLALLLPFIGFICICFIIGSVSSKNITHSNNIVTAIPQHFNRVAIVGNEDSDVFVASIKLSGPIMLSNNDNNFFDTDYTSANYALKLIKKAKADPYCVGIILDLTTPGGSVTDSDIIWKELQNFRNSKCISSNVKRKVIVLMGDTVASGGYYISTAADYIFAHPTTMTGSIGVIISSINATELAQKLGIAPVTIKSGKTKDFLNPLRPLAPEEEAMLQAMVNKLNERFIKLIVDGRGLEEAKVRAIADGRVMLADEALEHGLIDQIGYFNDVVEWLTNHIEGVDNICVYQYTPDDGFFSLFQSPTFIGKCAAEAVEEYSKKLNAESNTLTPAYK